jgi:hypothetical protein
MTSIIDATLLAATKLRTRKIRTAVTVVISSLLFGGLIAVLFVFQGASNSLKNFNSTGLGSRYIVHATNDPAELGAEVQNDAVKQSAEKIYQQTLKDESAEAKKLGIPFDTSSLVSPFFEATPSNGSPYKILNLASSAAQKALEDYQNTHQSPGLPALRMLAAPYHPISFYAVTEASPIDGQLQLMKHGEEDFSSSDQPGQQLSQSPDILQANPPEITPPQLVDPFLFHSTVNHTGHPNAIPLVVPYDSAAQLLGMSALPASAPTAQEETYIEELYAKAENTTFVACYRNTASQQQIDKAIQYQQSKDQKGYQKPDLIYGLPPANSCGPAKVISDTRSDTQKNIDAKQMQFDKLFGQIVEPKQRKIYFRIVGLSPNPPHDQASTGSAIFQSLAGSSLQGGLAIPSDMYQKLPAVDEYKMILGEARSYLPATGTNEGYYVEFANANDARRFIQDESCSTGPNGVCGSVQRPFILNAFGSNSLGLKELQDKFAYFFRVALLGVVVIAIIILSGTVGRMVADGRRETAVFRAIGASRADIAAVYVIYTFFLSLIVAFFALAIGTVVAIVFNHYFSDEATIQAKLAFGATNTDKVFHLFATTPAIWMVAIVAILAGLLSTIFPLLRNMRRNPISDLRDE